jgi:hypothetical protein
MDPRSGRSALRPERGGSAALSLRVVLDRLMTGQGLDGGVPLSQDQPFLAC